MVGNFDGNVEQQQRVGHLLSPLPPEMRNDTAFMDRLHAYAPGWEYPKLKPNEHLTNHFGFVSDFLSECWTKLRTGNRLAVMRGRVHLGGALSGRDIEAVNKSVNGLIKLVFPGADTPVSDEDLEWIVRLALDARRRVKEQQKRVFKSEFRNTHFSYMLGPDFTMLSILSSKLQLPGIPRQFQIPPTHPLPAARNHHSPLPIKPPGAHARIDLLIVHQRLQGQDFTAKRHLEADRVTRLRPG